MEYILDLNFACIAAMLQHHHHHHFVRQQFAAHHRSPIRNAYSALTCYRMYVYSFSRCTLAMYRSRMAKWMKTDKTINNLLELKSQWENRAKHYIVAQILLSISNRIVSFIKMQYILTGCNGMCYFSPRSSQPRLEMAQRTRVAEINKQRARTRTECIRAS